MVINQPQNVPPLPNNRFESCGHCSKNVCPRFRKIYCDICLKYFHYKCSIKISEFETLQNHNLTWTCSPCKNEIFPFSSVEACDFIGLFINDNLKDLLLQKKRKNAIHAQKL